MKKFKITLSLLCIMAVMITTLSPITAQQNKNKPKKKRNKYPLLTVQTTESNTKFHDESAPPEEPLSIWYRQPAKIWDEALPVGNGRLGCMVFGGISHEVLQLNEDTIWAKGPFPEPKTGNTNILKQARNLCFSGDYLAAEKLINQNFMSRRISPRSYQTLGNLHILQDSEKDIYNYLFTLNLDTAIVTTKYKINGINFKREVFSTPVDNVIVCKITADKQGSITSTFKMERQGKTIIKIVDNNVIELKGQAIHGNKKHGVKFLSHTRIINRNGKISSANNSIKISNADEVIIYIAAATDYNKIDPHTPLTSDLAEQCSKTIAAAAAKGYDAIKKDSVSEHQRLFRRVSLKLGEYDKSDKPIDERLAILKNGGSDTSLEALYFQYGRYLLISSSRPECMPANLQGIWNCYITAPWNSDYHININMQMNYWPAEVANLSECHLPFFDFIDSIVPAGQKAAQKLYNCRGFFATHTTDAWKYTTTFGQAYYGMWVMGGAWCTQHYIEHYRYSGDREFLEKRAYPILKEACLFFLDWLVEHPQTGKLVSGPSTSPENKFFSPGGGKASVSMGCSMDQEIIWETFVNFLEAASVLGINDSMTTEVKSALKNLALPRIGYDGRLMEWSEEFGEAQKGHRHISHLFGLHPGKQFTYSTTPDIMEASKKTIQKRLEKGGGHTGWSLGWIINFYARLRDAENAYKSVKDLLVKKTLPNLFDTHPPFQIDGNFGGCAGIAEMLIQSHEEAIVLLPTLPEAWSTGSFTRLCTRGGFEIDLTWKAKRIVSGKILSKLGKPCTIQFRTKVKKFETVKGQSYDIKEILGL